MTAPLSHFGRYRIVAELGRGAMGVVYRAQDDALDRQVAVKTILLPQDADERATYEARFLQEAKAAGSLNHPNIITIYDLGREGDWAFIAMELLDGKELRDLILDGVLTLASSLNIAAQVARALSAAHARNIVHRDIKPSNIMVQQGDLAKIMDFGIARMQESDVKTQTGMILGSPKYMSPEQVNGAVLDARGDLFSLAVILYEMVTGAPPFGGADLGQLMFNIVSAEPPPPSQSNHSIPKMLDLVIHKGLQKDPALRYQDGIEFAADLEACLAGLGAEVGSTARTLPGAAAAAAAVATGTAAGAYRDDGITANLPGQPHAADSYATTMLNLSDSGSGFATTMKTPQAGAGVSDDKTQRLPAAGAAGTWPAANIPPAVNRATALAAASTLDATAAVDATRVMRNTPAGGAGGVTRAAATPAAAHTPSMERRARASGTRLALSRQFDSTQALTALDAAHSAETTQGGAHRSGVHRTSARDLHWLIWPAAYTLAIGCAILIVFL